MKKPRRFSALLSLLALQGGCDAGLKDPATACIASGRRWIVTAYTEQQVRRGKYTYVDTLPVYACRVYPINKNGGR